MKRQILKALKEKGRANIFTLERYDKMKGVMKYGMTQDAWLKNYLELDPQNKVDWMVDHFILLTDKGHI